jgi:hypothetical protein
MNKAEHCQNALGFTLNEVAHIIDVTPADLKTHATGLKKLTFADGYMLDILYKYCRWAASDLKEYYTSEAKLAKQNLIKELLQQNEEQQKSLLKKISNKLFTCNQELIRSSLLENISDSSQTFESSFSIKLKAVLNKKTKPDFEKQLYQNQIKLKMLKYERRVLEQDLQRLIDTER